MLSRLFAGSNLVYSIEEGYCDDGDQRTDLHQDQHDNGDGYEVFLTTLSHLRRRIMSSGGLIRFHSFFTIFTKNRFELRIICTKKKKNQYKNTEKDTTAGVTSNESLKHLIS